jgi:flagellar biosynthetic protein FliR
MISFSVSPQQMAAFAVVLFRVAGIMVFAPFFNSGAIPAPVKAGISLVAALMLAPLVPAAAVPAAGGLPALLFSVLGEALIGMVLGLAASFVFAALQLAGQVVGFQLGYSIINVIDPQSDVQTSVISILYNFLGLVFFLMIDGHHWFFLAVSGSFAYLPAGGARLHGPLVDEMVRLSSGIFSAGVQIAGPVIAATATADVLMGIIGRVAPQINILVVGLPLKTLVGLGCMSIAFYFFPQFLGRSFLELAQVLAGLLPALR